jgi:hypothetical protein
VGKSVICSVTWDDWRQWTMAVRTEDIRWW